MALVQLHSPPQVARVLTAGSTALQVLKGRVAMVLVGCMRETLGGS